MKVTQVSETHVKLELGRFTITLGQMQGSDEPDGLNIHVDGVGEVAALDFYHAISGQPCPYAVTPENPRVMLVVSDPFVGENLGFVHYYDYHTIMYLESGIEIHSTDTLQKPLKYHTGRAHMHYLHFERDDD